MPASPLNDDFTRVAAAFAIARGDRGFTDEEYVGLSRWFLEIRLGNFMIDRVVAGEMTLDWDGREAVFRDLEDVTRMKGDDRR